MTQQQAPAFEVWSQDNLVKFAHDAYQQMQNLEDANQMLRQDLKDALNMVRESYKAEQP